MSHDDQGTAFTQLRAVLAEYTAPAGLVVFPGDQGVPAEGALTIAQAPDGSWTLATVDYGQPRVLRRAADAAGIETATIDYLLRPQNEPTAMPEAERERLLAAQAPHLMNLAVSAAEAPRLIDIPPGIMLDRIGALDGYLLYGAGTSFEARSLPPHVAAQRLRTFVTAAPLRVRVDITPAWFGRPGGGVRFTIEDQTVGIRDLVVGDVLTRLTPA